jgi:hypothetical protein
MMNRDRALKVVLVLVGLLFSAGILPMVIMVRSVLQPRSDNALPIVIRTADEAMMLSLYATLGIFLLLAARDPSAHRSVIAFTAWSSFAHAAVMAVMSIQVPTARAEWLITALVLGIIGELLIVLARFEGSAYGPAATVWSQSGSHQFLGCARWLRD